MVPSENKLLGPAAQPRDGFFDSAGVRLHYLDWGETGPVIILLAGLGDTASIYRGLAPKLSTSFRVLALTRRGHGRSEKPVQGYDLETLVDDITNFMDAMEIETATFVGASFAGLEMAHLAVRLPARVRALVFLDAVFPESVPEPDQSANPVSSLLPKGPSPKDLVSWNSLVAFRKRARPNLARIWCEAIEADLREKITVNPDSSITYNQDKRLLDQIIDEVWVKRAPAFNQLKMPLLAIVPAGDFHPGLPAHASEELRRKANEYWKMQWLPWVNRRTSVFREKAPQAKIMELDSPEHRIFLAREDETSESVLRFLVDS